MGLLRRLGSQSEIYKYITYIAYSMIVGVFSGLGAILFHFLLDEMRILFEPENMSRIFSVEKWSIALVPVAGGIIIASMNRAFPGIAKKRGVTSVIKSILLNNGLIPLKETVFHLLAPIISIGTGVPLGPEGPAAKIGSGIGSFMCQVFRLSPADMKMYTAAGAGAAIAAVFNAPIAGVFFGIEVILLNDIRNKQLGGFVIASVIASLTSRAMLGDSPVISIPAYRFPSLADYPVFIILGVMCGIVSLAFFFVSRAYGNLLDKKLRITNPYLRLLPLCVVFGLVLICCDEIFGLGYNTMSRVINGQFSGERAAVLLALKIVFMALFLRSGAHGGLFAPALGIGVLGGFVTSAALNAAFGLHTDPVVCSLASMGGVLAGINSIPLTSIMLVFELTNDYRIVPPLMLVSVISYLSVLYVNKGSVYALELHEEGINVSRYADHNLLSRIKVGELMRKDYEAVPKTMAFRELMPVLIDSQYNDVFVVDGGNNRLEGVISIRDIRKALLDSDIADILIAMDIASPAPSVTGDDTVSAAVMKLDEYDIENIPVIDSHESGIILGMITRHDIMRAYNRLLESGIRVKL